MAFMIPFAGIPFIFGEQMLLALGQNSQVAYLAGIQVRYQVFSAAFTGFIDLNKRWLSCLRVTFMPMVATVSANIVHVGLCFLFLDYYDMGIKGLALATSIKDGVALFSIIIYMRCSPKIS